MTLGEQKIEWQAENDVRGGPAETGPRQPISLAPHAVSGQPIVLANPASKVMPVMAERASNP